MHMRLAACQFITLPLWHGVVKPILGAPVPAAEPLLSIRIVGADIGHLTDIAAFCVRAVRLRFLHGCALKSDSVVYRPAPLLDGPLLPPLWGAKRTGGGELIIATGPWSLAGLGQQ